MDIKDKKVFVGVPCGKTPVCDSFYDCLYRLVLPEGSVIQRVKGGSVPQNLNKIIEAARDFDYVFIVEDDSMFHPLTVINLLSHDKDVVAGLCPNRNAPFPAYIYGDANENGLAYYSLKESDTGLIRVKATGMGGILIKMSVFDKLKKPYFINTFIGETEWGQDIWFGKSLVDAGIEVFCDTDVPIWHATHCALATMRKDGIWRTVIKIGEAVIEVPI